MLLKVFKSISNISAAELNVLERYLPSDAALAVYKHFRKEVEN